MKKSNKKGSIVIVLSIFSILILNGYIFTGFFSDNYDLEINETNDNIFSDDLEDSGISIPPYAEWKMNEGSGDNLNDTSGNNRNGTLTNMDLGLVWTDGITGSGLSTDGIDDYINCSQIGDFLTTNTFSLSMWVKTGTDTMSDYWLMGKQVAAANQRGYGLYSGSSYNNKLRFTLRNSALNEIVVEGSTSGLNNSCWQHIVVTYAGDSDWKGVKIYVNGTAETMTMITNTLMGGTIQNIADFQIIGRRGTNNLLDVTGLDECAIYPVVLTPSQVEELYQSQLPNYWYPGSIFIDDEAPYDGGSMNWSTAVSRPWCSGSGTYSDPYVIQNCRIDGQGTNPYNIYIKNSDAYFRIQNCTLLNTTSGGLNSGIIMEDVSNGTIYNNTIYKHQNFGLIMFSGSTNNTVCNNTVFNCSLTPAGGLNGNVIMYYATENEVCHNMIYNGINGLISFQDGGSGYNIIHNNTFNYNSQFGAASFLSNDDEFYDNICNNNTDVGIASYNSNRTIIEDNSACYSNNGGFAAIGGVNVSINYNYVWECGIGLANITNSNVTNNRIEDSNIGILLGISNTDYVNNSLIYNNTIIDCDDGIFCGNSTKENLIYFNNITNSIIYAMDNGTNNDWDNGTIGNYWSNYPGDDLDDDGIGDDPYDINGTAKTQDMYPIWNDGDSISPNVTIILPVNLTRYSSTPPDFIIEIDHDGDLNKTWYTFDRHGFKWFFTGNDTINQTGWDSLIDGERVITFYANDTSDNIGFQQVRVIKDTTSPEIIINSPTNGSEHDDTSPTYNVFIRDNTTEVNRTWYVILGSLTKYFFTSNGTISQSAWNSLADGLVIIRFYSNDTMSNEGYSELRIIKDTDEDENDEDEDDEEPPDEDEEDPIGGIPLFGFGGGFLGNTNQLAFMGLVIGVFLIYIMKKRFTGENER